ncbi:MAG TPA: hypothetical protein VIM04_01180 [Candidatus Binatia bacterium]
MAKQDPPQESKFQKVIRVFLETLPESHKPKGKRLKSPKRRKIAAK